MSLLGVERVKITVSLILRLIIRMAWSSEYKYFFAVLSIYLHRLTYWITKSTMTYIINNPLVIFVT